MVGLPRGAGRTSGREIGSGRGARDDPSSSPERGMARASAMWTLVRVRYAIASPEQVDDLHVYDEAEGADFLVDDRGSFVRLGGRARRALVGASTIPLDCVAARHALRRRCGAFRMHDGVVVVLRPVRSHAWPRAVARGYVADARARSPGLRSALRSLWGMTIAESQVAELAMDGLTAEEIALALGSARGTVQVHLRNIFRKVGVHRQAALVALLWRTLPRWD